MFPIYTTCAILPVPFVWPCAVFPNSTTVAPLSSFFGRFLARHWPRRSRVEQREQRLLSGCDVIRGRIRRTNHRQSRFMPRGVWQREGEGRSTGVMRAHDAWLQWLPFNNNIEYELLYYELRIVWKLLRIANCSIMKGELWPTVSGMYINTFRRNWWAPVGEGGAIWVIWGNMNA